MPSGNFRRELWVNSLSRLHDELWQRTTRRKMEKLTAPAINSHSQPTSKTDSAFDGSRSKAARHYFEMKNLIVAFPLSDFITFHHQCKCWFINFDSQLRRYQSNKFFSFVPPVFDFTSLGCKTRRGRKKITIRWLSFVVAPPAIPRSLGSLPQVRKEEDRMATSIICMTIRRKLISSGSRLHGERCRAIKTGGNSVFEYNRWNLSVSGRHFSILIELFPFKALQTVIV